ncbi:MAG: hypothetical protein AAF985_03355 [Bacteroidota bacterium]
MKMLNLSKLFILLFVSSVLFHSCTKDPLIDPTSEEYAEIISPEEEAALEQLSNIDLTDYAESATTRSNTCDIFICANFTGNGRYRVILPNGTIIFVNLNAQTVTINGFTFPLVNNQLCQNITVTGSSTANLGFKGTGSVTVTATVNGVTSTIFTAGVGTTAPVSVIQDVTLTCPPHDDTCELLICANFSGNGRYRVGLPNGTIIFVNLNAQTVTIGSATFPLINNQLCETITISGSSTADLAFKGTGSVEVEVTYPDGTVCEVFSAGVGTTAPVSSSQSVTLTCDPPC